MEILKTIQTRNEAQKSLFSMEIHLHNMPNRRRSTHREEARESMNQRNYHYDVQFFPLRFGLFF